MNTISLCHQREPFLRLSLEFVTVGYPTPPDDQLEVRTSVEETIEQLIDFVPVSPKVYGRFGKLKRRPS